jgi:membrane protein
MTRLELAILKWAPVRIIADIAKRIVLPGFQGVSLYEVTGFFYKEIQSTRHGERCAAVTYNFLMAMPPTLLFLFSLIPYLPLKDVEETVLHTISIFAPNKSIYESVSAVVTDFMHTERRDLLSIGVLMTLYFSSNGMMGLMKSFDRAMPVYVKRTSLRRRWIAVKLTFILIGVAMLSIAAFILQTEAVNGLLLKIFDNVMVIKAVSFLIMVAVIFCAISIIYTYGPSLSHKFNFVSPGSVFATIASVVTTSVFFFMVNHFLNYNKVYGSIGTLIAFMVWVWMNTNVILIGYELNVSILLGKVSLKKHEAEQNAV